MDDLHSQDRHEVVIATTAVRSAVVGGSPLVLPFRGVNGNSRSARRYREIATAIADDLGGPDKLSEPTKILVRQATALTLEVESLQAKIVAGESLDHEQLTRLTNSLSRLLHRLGLRKPAPKPISPLAAHFAQPPVRGLRGEAPQARHHARGAGERRLLRLVACWHTWRAWRVADRGEPEK
jgi:hypothetical protein